MEDQYLSLFALSVTYYIILHVQGVTPVKPVVGHKEGRPKSCLMFTRVCTISIGNYAFCMLLNRNTDIAEFYGSSR